MCISRFTARSKRWTSCRRSPNTSRDDLGFDDESLHWTAMAVRESVVNAITHGNESDPAKIVFIDYCATPEHRTCRIHRVACAIRATASIPTR